MRKSKSRLLQIQLAISTPRVENIKIILGFETKEPLLPSLSMKKKFRRSNELHIHFRISTLQQYEQFKYNIFCFFLLMSVFLGLKESGCMKEQSWVNSIFQMQWYTSPAQNKRLVNVLIYLHTYLIIQENVRNILNYEILIGCFIILLQCVRVKLKRISHIAV